MSASCDNPNCPIHGTKEKQDLFNSLKAEIVTNNELMDIIRVIAVNVDAAIAAKVGFDLSDEEIVRAHTNILMGDSDSSPAVQGAINGFISLMKSHQATKQFAVACREVPEDQGFLTSLREKHQAATDKFPALSVVSFNSTEEFFNYLLRRNL